MPPQQWTIDGPKLEDAEDLAHMHAQSWRDTYPGIQPGITDEWVEEHAAAKESPEGIERYKSHIAAALEDPEHRYYMVARDGSGKAVGFVAGSKTQEEQRLHAFYLDKSFQGSGVATALGEDLQGWLDPGRDTLLGVAVNNGRAIHFYEKLGFELQPGTEHDFGGGLMEIEMVKPGVQHEV